MNNLEKPHSEGLKTRLPFYHGVGLVYHIGGEFSRTGRDPNPDIEKIDIANLEDLERIFLK